MKKVFSLLNISAFVLFSFLTVSCKEDDENPAPIKDDNNPNTEYNNNKYTIKNGYFENIGAVDYFSDEDAEVKTHSSMIMALSDGLRNTSGSTDGKILMVSSLLSPGTNGFKTGTFEVPKDYYDDMEELEEDEFDAKYKNKYFAPLVITFIDTDGDKNWAEETPLIASEGTFKVSGTSPNFTTEYDLKFEDGKTLKGKYSGKFTQATDLE